MNVERGGPPPSYDRRHETAPERLDRNLEELTGELRVIVTGVQVLFAFLLVVPFNVGFTRIGDYARGVYFVTLVLAALAALCMIAPAAHHRFLFRHGDKRHVVSVANRLAIAGIAFLALAMCGSLLLVATKLFGPGVGAVAAALCALPFAAVWFALPLRRRAALDELARHADSESSERRGNHRHWAKPPSPDGARATPGKGGGIES